MNPGNSRRRIPNSSPKKKPIRLATTASRSVLTTARITSSVTERPEAIDVPRSPCNAFQIQMPNCTGSGRSKPYALRICAASSCEASGGSTDTNGSPGAIWTRRKQTIETPITIGIV
jgi:hypothetical protein